MKLILRAASLEELIGWLGGMLTQTVEGIKSHRVHCVQRECDIHIYVHRMSGDDMVRDYVIRDVPTLTPPPRQVIRPAYFQR